MRIKATEQKAANILAVLLDGKRISEAAELDTEEGWVDVILPKNIPPPPGKKEELKLDTSLPIPTVEWERKRYHGEVKVIWADSSTVDDKETKRH